MMRNHFLLALLTLQLLTQVSCSVKKTTTKDNKAPVVDEVRNRPDQPRVSATSASQLETLDLGAVSIDLRQNPDAQLVMQQSLKPLADVLLRPETYNSSSTSDDKFKNALKQFHSDIRYLEKVDPTSLRNSGILDRYQKVLLVDCKPLQGRCHNLTVYTRDAGLAPILEILARNSEDVVAYFRLLKISIERFRPSMDQATDELVLLRANDLLKHYIGSATCNPGAKPIPASDVDELRVLARLVQNKLLNYDPSKASQEQLDKLVKVFDVWSMSRRCGNILNYGMDKLLVLASMGYLYGKDKTLNPLFINRVRDILNEDDEIVGMGALHIRDWIDSQPSGGILKNLDLDGEIPVNEFAYLVNRVYYRHFTLNDGAAFWKMINQNGRPTENREELFKAINQFIRLQIAYLVVWTNEQTSKFFEDHSSSIGDLRGLFEGAVNNSGSMSAKWSDSITQLKDLLELVDNLFGATELSRVPETDPYRVLSDSYRDISRNVKLLSVYPNMMMFAYFMSSKNLRATFSNFWGEQVTITPDQVINQFFVDVMKPWFSFGTDADKISQVELLYALHFALATETFSTFRNNKVVPISPGEFFREITEKLTNKYVQEATDTLIKFSSYQSTNSDVYQDTLKACREERELQESGNMFAARMYNVDLPFDKMGERLSNGFGDIDATRTGSIGGFYKVMTGFTGTVTMASGMRSSLIKFRREIEARLLLLRNMEGILVTYLKNRGENVGEVTKAYREEIAKLTSLRDKYVVAIYQGVELFGDCDRVLFKREMALRDEVYRREQAYLGEVFDNLVNLNNLSSSAAEQEAKRLNSKMADKLEKDPELMLRAKRFIEAKGFDRYAYNETEKVYYYGSHEFETRIRLRRYLTEISPTSIQISLPAFDSLAEYSKYNSPVMRRFESNKYPTKVAFVEQGMKQFVIDAAIEAHVTPKHLIAKLGVLSDLYRLGPVSKSTGAPNCAVTPAEDIRGVELSDKCYEITAGDLINETLETIRVSDLSAMDVDVLKWTGKATKHEDDFWTALAMEANSRRPLGLLDVMFLRVASDAPETAGTVQVDTYTDTEKYYQAEKVGRAFFFQPADSVKELIKDNYGFYVNHYEERVETFLKAYREFQLNDTYNIEKVRRSLDNYIPVGKETVPGTGTVANRYITPGFIEMYQSIRAEFATDTNEEFKPK